MYERRNIARIEANRFIEPTDCFLPLTLPTVNPSSSHDRFDIVWQPSPGDSKFYPRLFVVTIDSIQMICVSQMNFGKLGLEAQCLLDCFITRGAMCQSRTVSKTKRGVRFRGRTVGQRELWIESDCFFE